MVGWLFGLFGSWVTGWDALVGLALLTEYYERCDAVGEGEEAVEELLGRGGVCFLHVGFHCVVCIVCG